MKIEVLSEITLALNLFYSFLYCIVAVIVTVFPLNKDVNSDLIKNHKFDFVVLVFIANDSFYRPQLLFLYFTRWEQCGLKIPECLAQQRESWLPPANV